MLIWIPIRDCWPKPCHHKPRNIWKCPIIRISISWGFAQKNGLDILQKYEPQDVEVCKYERALRAAKHSHIVTQVTQFFATQD